MPQPVAHETFFCVQTQANVTLKHQCLSERRTKASSWHPAGRQKGSWIEEIAPSPQKGDVHGHRVQSKHREERPGEEVEELGASWMLTAPGLLLPSVLEINIKTQS